MRDNLRSSASHYSALPIYRGVFSPNNSRAMKNVTPLERCRLFWPGYPFIFKRRDDVFQYG